MGILDQLIQSGSSIVELGRIESFQGNSLFKVTIAGEVKSAYSTLNIKMEAGTRVIINKSNTGRRYIVGKAGIKSQQKIEEVFRNG